ncbi:hypothetical protein AAG570_003855, partial [Ranatra chinensis]
PHSCVCRLLEGINNINSVDGQKFQLLLVRIIQEMLRNPESNKPFTDEEQEKLMNSLSLSQDDLNLLINTSILIISQAVYNITKPAQLQLLLVENLKIDEEKAVAFVNVWTSNAKKLVGKMKQKSVYSTQLDSVSWLVNIEMSSTNNPQTFVPKATLQLKLKESDARCSNLNLDMDENQLMYLYDVLENIQTELDTLK